MLEPPPPWPDPPTLVHFGYAQRWCKLSFPHHKRRFGQVSTYYLFDFPDHMPFVVAVLGCWFALAACLLVCWETRRQVWLWIARKALGKRKAFVLLGSVPHHLPQLTQLPHPHLPRLPQLSPRQQYQVTPLGPSRSVTVGPSRSASLSCHVGRVSLGGLALLSLSQAYVSSDPGAIAQFLYFN